MPVASPNYVHFRVSVTPATWAAVKVPIGCDNLLLYNTLGTDSVRRRTNSDDPSTEKLIPVGSQMWIQAGMSNPAQWPLRQANEFRFPAGSIVCYLQSVSGSFDVDAEVIQ